MFINFKKTTWERAYIYNEDKDKVLKMIKDKSISNAFELTDNVDVEEWEEQLECDEAMTVEENGNSATLEVYEYDENTQMDELIYENGE